MKTIYKCSLKLKDENIIKIPEKSEIMDIQMQNGLPVMWVLVDTDSPVIDVKISIYGTGCNIPEGTTENDYIATVQDGSMVWHFFLTYEKYIETTLN